MNYSRAFSYVFEDKDWLSKILIAGLISLIPVVGQLYLLGWMIEIVRRVKAGRTDVVPTTHFVYFLTLGLKLFVVSLIYSIPVIILSGILSLISNGGSSDSSFASAFLAGLGCVGGLITFVVNIAVALLGTYGAIKLAETDQIKACLDFNDAFSCIKNNLSTFIIVELLAIVAGLIQSAGVILCLVGAIFTAPYGVAIIGHLVGQLWDNLKPYEKSARSFRGSVSKVSDDIIEEAPFTMVQDIEKDIAESDISEQAAEVCESVMEEAEEAAAEAEQAADEIIEEAAPIFEETETAEAEADDVREEEPAEEVSESGAEDAEPEEKSDDDLPNFE